MKAFYIQLESGRILKTTLPQYLVTDPKNTKLPQAQGKEAHRDQCIKELRQILRPGDTIYCVLRRVSASGMSQRIDLYRMSCKGDAPVYLTSRAAVVLGYRRSDKGGMVVSGGDMGRGFHCVYTLARCLFPDGFVPSKAGMQGRDGEPDDKLDTDGGYALKFAWL